jgi:hypothetical protein
MTRVEAKDFLLEKNPGRKSSVPSRTENTIVTTPYSLGPQISGRLGSNFIHERVHFYVTNAL